MQLNKVHDMIYTPSPQIYAHTNYIKSLMFNKIKPNTNEIPQ